MSATTTSVSPLTRAPYGGFARNVLGLAATVGVIAVLIDLAGAAPPAPAPKPAFAGRIGPPKVTIAGPSAAGALKQAVTLTFTRPRSGQPYDVLQGVSVRLVPKKLALVVPGLAAGGSVKPLKAIKSGPGVWTVTLASETAVALPGAWSLHVSAVLHAGKAFKADVPLTYG